MAENFRWDAKCGYTTLPTTQDVIYVYAVGCVVCKDDEFSSCVLGGI